MAPRMCVMAALLAVAVPAAAGSGEDGEEPQRLISNPFDLPRPRIVPGTQFRVDLVEDGLDAEKDKVSLRLRYPVRPGPKPRTAPVPFDVKVRDGKRFLEARMPAALEGLASQSPWRGVFLPYQATLLARIDRATGESAVFELPVRIPSVPWAYFWGVAAVLATLLLLALLQPEILPPDPAFPKDSSREAWKKRPVLERALLYPLSFTVTPVGRYSLSLTQILVWTYVTIFGLVYVYWLTGSFLEVTPQVLALLGIGGGTAVSTKVNAQSKAYAVPARYLALVEKRRVPRLLDLVASEGRPNVFKFQMLVFTLLTAYLVLVAIARSYAFPPIPESLVALMGISSAIYVGNEVAQKSDLQKIEEKVKEVEAERVAGVAEAGSAALRELRGLLERVYQ